MEGRKPLVFAAILGNRLADYNNRFAAFRWILDRGDGAILFAQVPDDCRPASNYLCVSELHTVPQDAPASVTDLVELLDWLQSREVLQFPIAGHQAHHFLVSQLNALAAIQAKIVADLESHLDAMSKKQYEKMAQLKTFLKID